MIAADRQSHTIAGAHRIVITVRIAGYADQRLPQISEESLLGALRFLLAPHIRIPVHRMQFRRCILTGPLVPGLVLSGEEQATVDDLDRRHPNDLTFIRMLPVHEIPN